MELRRQYALALRVAGYDVVQAANGLAALQVIESGLATDLMILDLGLPVVNGHAVLQDFLQSDKRHTMAVLVVTGTDDTVENLDPDCVHRKPVSPERLVRLVAECLALKTSRHQQHD